MEETTRVELHLPSDVVAIMQKGEQHTLEERVKTSLAIGLFAEHTISLAKAARLAGLSRYEFALLLKRSGLPAYEYTSTDYEEDIISRKLFITKLSSRVLVSQEPMKQEKLSNRDG